jgi:uncharacterized membrane protein YedE/YeeE
MSSAVYVLFGAAFGFALVQARAADPAAIVDMFLLRDLHLFGVIGSAVATAAVGFALVARRPRALSGAACELGRKPFHDRVLAGGVVFGAGWALSATCPGTALAQLGEGKLYALATIAGIAAGSALHALAGKRIERALPAFPRAGAS